MNNPKDMQYARDEFKRLVAAAAKRIKPESLKGKGNTSKRILRALIKYKTRILELNNSCISAKMINKLFAGDKRQIVGKTANTSVEIG